MRLWTSDVHTPTQKYRGKYRGCTPVFFICGYPSLKFGAILHEKDNYQWTCKEFFNDSAITRGSNNVFPGGPGEGVSLITVFLQPNPDETPQGTGVTLYKEIDYQGESLNVGTSNRDDLGAWDDKARSIKIDGNYMALLFHYHNYESRCEVLMDNDPNLENNPVAKRGDTISSIKIIPIKK